MKDLVGEELTLPAEPGGDPVGPPSLFDLDAEDLGQFGKSGYIAYFVK